MGPVLSGGVVAVLLANDKSVRSCNLLKNVWQNVWFSSCECLQLQNTNVVNTDRLLQMLFATLSLNPELQLGPPLTVFFKTLVLVLQPWAWS